jgi:hypothetical protein
MQYPVFKSLTVRFLDKWFVTFKRKLLHHGFLGKAGERDIQGNSNLRRKNHCMSKPKFPSHFSISLKIKDCPTTKCVIHERLLAKLSSGEICFILFCARAAVY